MTSKSHLFLLLISVVISVTICVTISGCSTKSNPFPTSSPQRVVLTEGIDASASDPVSGEINSYIITTPTATYYLDKQGGGLSSMLDINGVDWIDFNNKKGSGWKGEYRGFPNAIHKQDGSYFHAINAGTDLSSSVVSINTAKHVRIEFTSDNKQWQGIWDFYPDRCDFTMSKVSEGYHYWVLYEGVPNGKMDVTDFWYSSADSRSHLIAETLTGDLPHPEWIAFGDADSTRMLYLLNHNDDSHPDEYVSRPYMTVFGFGRSGKGKFIDGPQRFSLGFIESTDYAKIDKTMKEHVAD